MRPIKEYLAQMKIQLTLLLLVLSLMMSSSLYAQESDTLVLQENEYKHSPRKATIMSLVVPGLGQAYNKKYWKIPLVYAAIGVPLYVAMDQQSMFNEFKSAYLKRVDGDPNTIDSKYDGVYTDANLENLIDFHRKNRDLFYVLTGVAYILNVVDAAVDAHLYHFEVSDDLSAVFKPDFQYLAPQQTFVPSLTLSLKFGAKKPVKNF